MFRSPARVALGILALSLIVGYLFAGGQLYNTFVGLDPSAFPAGQAIQDVVQGFAPDMKNAIGGAVWALLTLLVMGGLGFASVRTAVRARKSAVDPGRRSFLTGAGSGALVGFGSMLAAAGGAASRAILGAGTGADGWRPIQQHILDRDMTFTHPEPKASWEGSRIESYRRFGRTGWNVSDIVLGTGRIRGEDGERIARLALDRGVNYFDTSPDYSGAGSENAMGKAIKGRRDELFIATKFCTPAGHLPAGASVRDYKTAVEGSLQLSSVAASLRRRLLSAAGARNEPRATRRPGGRTSTERGRQHSARGGRSELRSLRGEALSPGGARVPGSDPRCDEGLLARARGAAEVAERAGFGVASGDAGGLVPGRAAAILRRVGSCLVAGCGLQAGVGGGHAGPQRSHGTGDVAGVLEPISRTRSVARHPPSTRSLRCEISP